MIWRKEGFKNRSGFSGLKIWDFSVFILNINTYMFCGSFSVCNVSQHKRSAKAQHSMFHLEMFERQIYIYIFIFMCSVCILCLLLELYRRMYSNSLAMQVCLKAFLLSSVETAPDIFYL